MTPKCVLVAVTDDDIRSGYTTALRDGGYVALEARNVSEALGLVTWHMPAAVISGPMTGPEGPELLRCLREHPLTAAIPVILVPTGAQPHHWPGDLPEPIPISAELHSVVGHLPGVCAVA